MSIFRKNKVKLPPPTEEVMLRANRSGEMSRPCSFAINPCEKRLYDGLRFAVPVIDAALCKIVRLTGGYRAECSDLRFQHELDEFVSGVSVGLTGQSLNSFTDSFLDSLLTYGNAVGEILINPETLTVAGLYNGNAAAVEIGGTPENKLYYRRKADGTLVQLPNPELIVFSALNPPAGKCMGVSVLRGLPALSSILLRIYECIGQNYDRVGNVRYAITYKPSGDAGERAYSRERVNQIAHEWSEGMSASQNGQVKDFVAVGDVDIKVIGAENQLIDTNVPVRQLLEQLVSKLSIPPFLLGLNWSSTERMSAQQADILTSELEYYRRLLTPVISHICRIFLRLSGSTADVKIVWENINLQDETELAEARLKNAQALEIEERLVSFKRNP